MCQTDKDGWTKDFNDNLMNSYNIFELLPEVSEAANNIAINVFKFCNLGRKSQ